MKFISIYLLSTALFLVMSSTNNSEIDSTTTSTFPDQIEVEVQNLDSPGPDLIATNFRSSLPFGTGPCPGGPRADGTCNGGPAPVFRMAATITNQGNIGILPGVPFKFNGEVQLQEVWCKQSTLQVDCLLVDL